MAAPSSLPTPSVLFGRLRLRRGGQVVVGGSGRQRGGDAVLLVEPGAEVDQLAAPGTEGEKGEVLGALVRQALTAATAINGLLFGQDASVSGLLRRTLGFLLFLLA